MYIPIEQHNEDMARLRAEKADLIEALEDVLSGFSKDAKYASVVRGREVLKQVKEVV